MAKSMGPSLGQSAGKKLPFAGVKVFFIVFSIRIAFYIRVKKLPPNVNFVSRFLRNLYPTFC
jgi:hypothetical protein